MSAQMWADPAVQTPHDYLFDQIALCGLDVLHEPVFSPRGSLRSADFVTSVILWAPESHEYCQAQLARMFEVQP